MIFKLQPVEHEERVHRVFSAQQEAVHQEFSGIGTAGRGVPAAEEAPLTAHRPVKAHQPVEGQKKVGRNDDCPCGSGKKYKKCCGK
jgi:uncharacterized protein YecA (UPF0149 family)